MKELNAEEWIFVGGYLTHGNASQAVRDSGYLGKHARDAGYNMMKRPHVWAEILRARDEMRASGALTVNDIVGDINSVLKADPRELIQYVTGSCRYCHGVDHEYHRTMVEMRQQRREAEAKGQQFDILGGEGYDAYADPHPDCPNCCGRGVQHARLKDTRDLSPEAAALYDGIEQTKHGIKIKLRSKDAARDAAARLLGLNKETVNVNVTKKLDDYTDAELIAMMEKKP